MSGIRECPQEPAKAGQASRERKERFLRSFDAYGGQLKVTKDAISDFLREDGIDWLTDDQLEQITARVVSNARDSVRRTVRNRAILRRAS